LVLPLSVYVSEEHTVRDNGAIPYWAAVASWEISNASISGGILESVKVDLNGIRVKKSMGIYSRSKSACITKGKRFPEKYST
jgi:hypothetical protein